MGQFSLPGSSVNQAVSSSLALHINLMSLGSVFSKNVICVLRKRKFIFGPAYQFDVTPVSFSKNIIYVLRKRKVNRVPVSTHKTNFYLYKVF
jgi:hypothetical protein